MFLNFLQKKISFFQCILETEQHRHANHPRQLLLAIQSIYHKTSPTLL